MQLKKKFKSHVLRKEQNVIRRNLLIKKTSIILTTKNYKLEILA